MNRKSAESSYDVMCLRILARVWNSGNSVIHRPNEIKKDTPAKKIIVLKKKCPVIRCGERLRVKAEGGKILAHTRWTGGRGYLRRGK